MKIDEFIASKTKLMDQLQELQSQMEDIRKDALEDIKRYIKELDITFIQMQQIYQELNLSTATIQIIKAKGPDIDKDRKGYVYFDSTSGKWFNGYNKLPHWFKVEKSDSYLLPGKKHTPIVKEALKAYGADKMKTAFTEAQLKHWKDVAEQWDKLYASKKFAALKAKIDQENTVDCKQISMYCNTATSDFIFENLP
jgi:hypothetical protein